MATGGNTDLTDDLIAKLSLVIDTTKMETIAINYFKIPSVTVNNERFDNQGNAMAFNRNMLTAWRNENYGGNQVQVSSNPQLSI